MCKIWSDLDKNWLRYYAYHQAEKLARAKTSFREIDFKRFFSIFVDKFYFWGELCWKIFEKMSELSSIIWLLVNYMSKITPSKHYFLSCCIKSLFYWIFPSLFYMLQNDNFSLFPRFEKKIKILREVRLRQFFLLQINNCMRIHNQI